MTLTFAPLVSWFWVATIAALLLAAELVPLWTRGRRVVTRARAVAISVVGVLAALAAVATLARPALTSETRRPTRGVVLVDASRSMATTDARGRSRAEAALEAANTLEKACPGATVSVIAFSGSSTTALPGSSDGETTAIGDALEQTLARLPGGEPLGAIAIVSDGDQRSGRDPVLVAREARANGTRVFTIATGLATTVPPPRLGRASLSVAARAPAGSTTTVRASVETVGSLTEAVALELSVDGQLVGRASVASGDVGAAREAVFEVPVGVEGFRHLSLRAQTPSQEARAAARIQVLPGRVRVALVDAPARWEHRYLRRALEDAPRVTLTRVDVWGAAGSTGDASAATIAAVASADVIVLGDVPARALAPEVGAAISRAVEEGAGLLVLAGRGGFEAAGALGLEPLLPVSVPGDAAPVNDPVRVLATDEGRALVRAGLGLPASDLLLALDRLPPLPDFVPLPPARRGATVLLESGSHRPLLALGRHGLGRTAILATDATWRWAFAPRVTRDARASEADELTPGAKETAPRETAEPTPGQLHAALMGALALALAPRDAGLRPACELVAGVGLDRSLGAGLDRSLGAGLDRSLGAGLAHAGEAIALSVRLDAAASSDAATAPSTVDFSIRKSEGASDRVLESVRKLPAETATLTLPRDFTETSVVVAAVARDASGRELFRDERVLEIAAAERVEAIGEPADLARLARIADAGDGKAFACEDVTRGAACVAFASALEQARPARRTKGPLAAGPGYAVLLALLLGAAWTLRRGGGLA